LPAVLRPQSRFSLVVFAGLAAFICSGCLVSINDYAADEPSAAAGSPEQPEGGQAGTGAVEPSAGGGGSPAVDLPEGGAAGAPPAGPRCGDDSVDDGEECDDGNRDTESCTYGETSCVVCNAQCKEQPGAASYCGDETTDVAAGEGCDDGDKNDTGPGSCSDACAAVQTCGDGEKQGTENCDDGALNGTDNNCDRACGVPWLVDAAAAAGGNGKSWETAFQKLETAISAANANGGGELWVKAGTYLGSTYFRTPLPALALVDNVRIYGGFAGGEKLLGERDWYTNKTILSTGSHNVVLASHVVVDGFWIESGNASDDYAAGGNNDFVTQGGGIYGENVQDVVLRNLVVQKNRGFTGGGGMFVKNSSVIVRNTLFDANTAGPAGSPGLDAVGGSLEIYDSKFVNHGYALGAGALGVSGSLLKIENTDFFGNTDSFEGPVVLTAVSGTARITNALFSNNIGPLKAGYPDGSGTHWGDVSASNAVWVTDDSKVLLTNITFYKNEVPDLTPEQPDVRGGAGTSLKNAFVYHRYGGTATVGVTAESSCSDQWSPGGDEPIESDRDGDGFQELYLNPLSSCVGSADNTAADLAGLAWKKLTTQESDCLDSGQVDAGKHYAPIAASGPCAN